MFGCWSKKWGAKSEINNKVEASPQCLTTTILAQIPTYKTAFRTELEEYVRHVTTHLDALLGLFMTMVFCMLR